MQKQWVHILKNPISAEDKSTLVGSLSTLLKSWDSHGKELSADVVILNDQLLIIYLDENSISASGCSVDKLNREISSIINSSKKELADRNMVPLYSGKEIEFVDRLNIKEMYEQNHITADHSLVDVNATYEVTRGFEQFLVPIHDSWLKNYIE